VGCESACPRPCRRRSRASVHQSQSQYIYPRGYINYCVASSLYNIRPLDLSILSGLATASHHARLPRAQPAPVHRLLYNPLPLIYLYYLASRHPLTTRTSPRAQPAPARRGRCLRVKPDINLNIYLYYPASRQPLTTRASPRAQPAHTNLNLNIYPRGYINDCVASSLYNPLIYPYDLASRQQASHHARFATGATSTG